MTGVQTCALPICDAALHGPDGPVGTGLDTRTVDLEIDGLRPYRNGSPASRIHWATVARTGEMVEHRVVGGADSSPLVVLDRFNPADQDSLDSAVRAGKALYVGISSYSAEKTREAAAILRDLGTPLLIHQPSYSMLNRWIEPDLLDAVGELGIGCIVFSPLAQGMLTDKYLGGIPEGSRASRPTSLSPDLITDEALAKIRALNEIASGRGQSLAQMALAWVLRDERVTSSLIGASSVAQLEDNIAALARLDFTSEELAEIDRYASDSAINIWAASSET